MSTPAPLDSVSGSSSPASAALSYKVSADKRPTDLEYALLSNHVYQSSLKKGDKVPKAPDWKIKAIYQGDHGYLSVLYFNKKTDHAVLSYRGTDNLSGLWEDIQSVLRNKVTTSQRVEAFVTVNEVLALVKEDECRLSFTGHSLGGFLAELSVFYCYRNHNYPFVSAVTFESPGVKECLSHSQSELAQGEVDLKRLDITGYVSYPNLVNTCHGHVGSLWSVEPVLGKGTSLPGWHLKQVHTMDNLVTYFEKLTLATLPRYATDWPVGKQRAHFFKHAVLEEGRYSLPAQHALPIDFDLTYEGGYEIHPLFHAGNTLPLTHFSMDLQEWLRKFYGSFRDYQQRHALAPQEAARILSDFVQEKRIDEVVASYLLAGCVETLPTNGLEVYRLLSSDVPLSIAEFRRSLSEYLEKNPEIAAELLGVFSPVVLSRPQTVLMGLEEGATAEEADFAVFMTQTDDTELVSGLSEQDQSLYRDHLKFAAAEHDKTRDFMKPRDFIAKAVSRGASVGKVNAKVGVSRVGGFKMTGSPIHAGESGKSEAASLSIGTAPSAPAAGASSSRPTVGKSNDS